MMKVFIWDYVANCSDSYHSTGGVVVFAETEERARELATLEYHSCVIGKDELPAVVEVVHAVEKVYIFPGAGCC